MNMVYISSYLGSLILCHLRDIRIITIIIIIIITLVIVLYSALP